MELGLEKLLVGCTRVRLQGSNTLLRTPLDSVQRVLNSAGIHAGCFGVSAIRKGPRALAWRCSAVHGAGSLGSSIPPSVPLFQCVSRHDEHDPLRKF